MKKLAIFKRREEPSRSLSVTPTSPSATIDRPQSLCIAQSTPTIASSSSDQSFPDGPEVWHDCAEATVDICFVHGLSGNKRSTWTAHGHSTPWPKAHLPPQLPNACLLTYGYDAYVVRRSAASMNRLVDHATNLLNDLTNNRASRGATSRPLIFVAHSLGGLVCKEAILLSRNNPESHLRDIFDNVVGIMFMGTPHRGSWMADWTKIPASTLGLVKSTNKSLLAVLETDNQLLDSIQRRFLSMVRELREAGRRLDVICFFEELPLSHVGHVVSKESATLEGYTSASIHADHRDMVRFDLAENTGFIRVVGELKRWAGQATNSLLQHGQGDVSSPALSSESAVSRVAEPCFHIPFRQNKRFVGRKGALEALRDKLFTQENPRAALVGLGGVGKTQVALQLAYWTKENRPDYSIFWVPMLSEATFEQAYVEMARTLPIRKRSDDKDIKESVRRFLSSEAAGPWLLVADNADDMDVLFESSVGIARYLPESDKGLTLFTTRSREVAVDAAGSDIVELQRMDSEEAVSLLGSLVLRKEVMNDTAALTELLNELTHLPLAIVQAAAYLNKKQVSIGKYLSLLRGAEKGMVSLMSKEFRDTTRYAGSQNAVTTTWRVSFEHIRRSSRTAANLLSFISCIEPKAIPHSILPQPETEEEMVDAIGTLCGYAFLTRRGESDTFDMHNLVHAAIRLWIEKQEYAKETEIAAIRHLAATFPSADVVNRGLWRDYLPHTLRVLYRSKEYEIDVKYDLCLRVGQCLDIDRRFKEAISMFEHVVAARRRTLAEEDDARLTAEHELASAYLDDRRIKEAIDIFEHVVAIRKRRLPEEDNSRLSSEHGLAKAYLKDRRIEEAIKIFEHVVAIRKRTLAEEDNSRLTSEHELASAYLDDRRIREAIDIFECVVTIQSRTLSEEDNSRLTSEHALARAYLDDGRVKEAVSMLQDIVAIRKTTLAEGDHHRLTSEHTLARAYLEDGRIQEAISMLESVLPIRKRTLSQEDHHRLTPENTLARAYLYEGRVEEAISMLEHVVAIRKRTLTEEDYERLASEQVLARAYGQRKGHERQPVIEAHPAQL